MSKEITYVGLPIPENEEPECLHSTLTNIDTCLNNLGIDSRVIVMPNGKNTATGNRVNCSIPRSQYNADIEIIYGNEPGQAPAIKQILDIAIERNVDKVFFMDDDIYAFPHAFKHMWQTSDYPFVGAHHLVYPLEIVEAGYRPMTEEEKYFYTVFEADKHPDIKQIVDQHVPMKKPRVKGSCMLLDAKWAASICPNETTIFDSYVNTQAQPDDITIAPQAVFMHMGRVSLEDHVKARFRHYVSSYNRNDIQKYANNQLRFNPDTAQLIAEQIKTTLPNGDSRASYFLLRCMLQQRLHNISLDVLINGNFPDLDKNGHDPYGTEVSNWDEAQVIVDTLLADVDWHYIINNRNRPLTTTLREFPRSAINVGQFMADTRLKGIILNNIGIKSDEEL